jgi:hypothetical protein
VLPPHSSTALTSRFTEPEVTQALALLKGLGLIASGPSQRRPLQLSTAFFMRISGEGRCCLLLALCHCS